MRNNTQHNVSIISRLRGTIMAKGAPGAGSGHSGNLRRNNDRVQRG